MPGDLRLVTEKFLADNFGDRIEIPFAPGTNDIIEKSCDQVLARYDVLISGVRENTLRCPSQNEISVPTTPGDLYFPNAFSPNGDGIHDLFEIQNLENYPNNEMWIFDQNGSLVYNTTSYHNAEWNGRYNNTGSMAPVGTYYFTCRINGSTVKKGTVFSSY
jgi:gliding motility-associated-like protein